MTTLRRSSADRLLLQLSASFGRLADEVVTLLDAMLNPGRIIAEVEQMRSLQLLAARVEASDPARAAMLRERAARIGLR